MEKFSGPIARRYGTALFESLKEDYKDDEDKFFTASNYIKNLTDILKKSEYKIFQSYGLNFEQKQSVISTILNSLQDICPDKKLSQRLFNFFSIIIKHKRFAYFSQIMAFYFNEVDSFLGITRAEIVSAKAISKNTLDLFEKSIANNLQKKVVFSNFIDESLQCGFLIKIGPTQIEASLKSFLTKLNEAVR